jgi:hypothetical protein
MQAARIITTNLYTLMIKNMAIISSATFTGSFLTRVQLITAETVPS